MKEVWISSVRWMIRVIRSIVRWNSVLLDIGLDEEDEEGEGEDEGLAVMNVSRKLAPWWRYRRIFSTSGESDNIR